MSKASTFKAFFYLLLIDYVCFLYTLMSYFNLFFSIYFHYNKPFFINGSYNEYK